MNGVLQKRTPTAKRTSTNRTITVRSDLEDIRNREKGKRKNVRENLI